MCAGLDVACMYNSMLSCPRAPHVGALLPRDACRALRARSPGWKQIRAWSVAYTHIFRTRSSMCARLSADTHLVLLAWTDLAWFADGSQPPDSISSTATSGHASVPTVAGSNVKARISALSHGCQRIRTYPRSPIIRRRISPCATSAISFSGRSRRYWRIH